jgi:ssDNA-binding Zn-finger/Zn-ribbon topoisomerase 1
MSEGLWIETGGESEYLEERERERERWEKIEKGLARCPICGEKAKVKEFGLGGIGLWVGCDRSEECVRNIEYHSEGWSFEEVAEEWNRRNRGIRLLIRRIKMWFERNFGERKKFERKELKERERIKKEIEKKRNEIFGIKEEKKGWLRVKFWRKGK